MPTLERRTPGLKGASHLPTATRSASPHSAVSSKEAFVGRQFVSPAQNLDEAAAGIPTHPTGLVPLHAHPSHPSPPSCEASIPPLEGTAPASKEVLISPV